jgi:hypothetical protein
VARLRPRARAGAREVGGRLKQQGERLKPWPVGKVEKRAGSSWDEGAEAKAGQGRAEMRVGGGAKGWAGRAGMARLRLRGVSGRG